MGFRGGIGEVLGGPRDRLVIRNVVVVLVQFDRVACVPRIVTPEMQVYLRCRYPLVLSEREVVCVPRRPGYFRERQVVVVVVVGLAESA